MFNDNSTYGSLPLTGAKKEGTSRVWTVIGLMFLLSLSLNLYSFVESFGNGKLATLNHVIFGSDLAIADTFVGYTSTLDGVIGVAQGTKNVLNKDNNGPIIEICAANDGERITGIEITYEYDTNSGTIGVFEDDLTGPSALTCPCPSNHACFSNQPPAGTPADKVKKFKYIHGIRIVHHGTQGIIGIQLIADQTSAWFGPHASQAAALAAVAGSSASAFIDATKTSTIRKMRGRFSQASGRLMSLEVFFGDLIAPGQPTPAKTGWQGEVGNTNSANALTQVYQGNDGPVWTVCTDWVASGLTGVYIGYSPNFGNSATIGMSDDEPVAPNQSNTCPCPSAIECFAPPSKHIEGAEVYWRGDDIVAMQFESSNAVSFWMGLYVAKVVPTIPPNGPGTFYKNNVYDAVAGKRCIRKIMAYTNSVKLRSIDFYYGEIKQPEV